MVTVKQIYKYLDEIMPFETQESWDNSGLLVDSGEKAEKVLAEHIKGGKIVEEYTIGSAKKA